MRALLAVLLVGCTLSPRGDRCSSDASCTGGDVCTRSGDCLAPSEVRAVRVTWLVSGKTPDEATCAPHPDLRIEVYPEDERDRVDYAPVPCVVGLFTIDKLPATFDRVWLGPQRGGDDDAATGKVDAAGALALDLPF